MGTHFLIQNLTFSKRPTGIKDGLNTAFFSLSMMEKSSEGSPLEVVFLIERGLKIMQEALHKKTALLPYVELARPIEIIGGDTVSSIRAGIIYGVASLCDGITRRLLEKECRGFKVIATGGDALLIKPYCRFLNRIEESLILKGLALIHKSQSIKK